MPTDNRIKIFFVTLAFQTFIKRDLQLLKKHFDVRIGHYTGIKSIPKILKGVLCSDLTFSWFADIHTFYSVLFSQLSKKKSVVIVGGYDAAKVPEINYGLALSPVFLPLIKYVFKNADKVLVVDESLKKDAIKNFRLSGENIQTVPTGYDKELWKSKGIKEDLVITVTHIKKESVKRKGLETFVLAADYLKEFKFVIIGAPLDNSIHYLKSIASPNVVFPGSVPNEELPQWYSRAKVYCQLSRYEGLPNALCEAMLCECVPVGTRYCGIPHAIGNTGFYVPYGDVKATVDAIKKALNSNKGKEARERIKKFFPLDKREKQLVHLIYDLYKKKRNTT